LLPDLAMELV